MEKKLKKEGVLVLGEFRVLGASAHILISLTGNRRRRIDVYHVVLYFLYCLLCNIIYNTVSTERRI